jgi:DNA polymerase I
VIANPQHGFKFSIAWSTGMEHFSNKIEPSLVNAHNPMLRQNFTTEQSIDKRINSILKEMGRGFQIDGDTLIGLKRSYESTLLNLKEEMQEKLGKAIRINSNEDLGNLLFNNLGLPSLRRTPTGMSSVSIDVLERLYDPYSNVYPILGCLIEFKNVQTLVKSLKTVSKKLDLQGRIHPEFNHYTCPTGRIYSYIQNLPKKVRKVLIPDEEDNTFIQLDWSQQELRIIAALSQEPVFLDCFDKNEDLHKRVISEMFHKPLYEVTDEERKVGKTINYALIYGQEAPGLSWNLNIPLKKAQELIDQYFSSLPMIQKFKDESRERFLQRGYSETAFGRKTQLDLTGPKRERELRRGFNHIFQGAGADILRMTLVRLKDGLMGNAAKLKFCSHDAIYIETKKEASGEIGELARFIMEIEFKGVRLPVTMKIYNDFSMGD